MAIFIGLFVIFVFSFSLCIMRIIKIMKEEKENANLKNTNKLIKFIYLYYAENKKKFLESFKILHDEFKVYKDIT